MNDIDCVNELTCVAMAEGPVGGLILHTTDGGNSWQKVLVEEGEHGSCMSVAFVPGSASEVRGWQKKKKGKKRDGGRKEESKEYIRSKLTARNCHLLKT